jgi:hypothetical protein
MIVCSSWLGLDIEAWFRLATVHPASGVPNFCD